MDVWYDQLPLGDISSFRQLIEIFYNQWDTNTQKKILKTMEDKQASKETKEILDDESKDQEAIIEETKGCT